jgi:DNA-binding response OmpR family regulator
MSTETSMSDRNRQLVLVVEDNPHEREIYGRILWYNGFDVIFALDGEAALRMADEQRPDLVLLDLGLPDVPGLLVCEQLRQRAYMANVPVIVLSGMARERHGPQLRRAGCTQYLEKPASPIAVLHEVERFIGRPPRPGQF